MDYEFSAIDLFSYWNTLTNYINPLSIILWAVIGGGVAFFLTLAILLIFRKKVLVARRNWFIQIISYLYMIALPLLAGFCFSQWFALNNCQSQMINNIPVYLGKANSVFNIYLKDEIAKIAGAKYLEMTGKEIMGKTADLTKKSVSDNMPPVEGDFGAMLSYHLVHTDFFKEQIISRLAETLEMDENMTREVLDVKIQNLFEEGVLNAIIEQQLRNIFGTLKLNFLLVFFVVLCLAIAEIALANYWEKKKQEKSQTPQG